ncbi:MAG: M1 family metallopeptidase [bacterium]|nr:M1 family metallopeptidase [bacterium]
MSRKRLLLGGKCMKVAALSVAALFFAFGIGAQEHVVEYEIQVVLDPQQHSLLGEQTVRWKNSSPVATNELWFHLYLNAFANDSTTFNRETGGRAPRSTVPASSKRGWITVNRCELEDGTDLLATLSFERQDDGNLDDFTVARMRLPEEIPPGAWVEFDMEFEAQLPKVMARTGFAGDFHMVGQWFPKLGVFEGQDGWNCHQFHATTEFFADFGSYDVEIVVPTGWTVVGTGLEIHRDSDESAGPNRDRVVYQADRVHDFAWCSAPSSLMTMVESSFEPSRDVPVAWLQRAQERLGLGADELELPSTEIRLVLPVAQSRLADRMLRAARLAMAWYGLQFGAYPYPQLTIVSPPIGAHEAGGMEYPTLITTGADLTFAIPGLSARSQIESVTVHEFGHQYFYGLLANNEFEEAWLDEGLTSYTQNECMKAIAEEKLVSETSFPIDTWAWERLSHAFDGSFPVRVDQPGWHFRNRFEYYAASYTKAALAMKTLEGLLGPETMARALRAYVQNFRFAHPNGDDLLEALSEYSGRDLEWFSEQVVRGDTTPDWAITRVRQRPLDRESVEGMQWTGTKWQDAATFPPKGGGPGQSRWYIEVDLARNGDLVGPVDVLLVYGEGREERRQWNGRERWTRWAIESDEPLVRAAIDPNGIWLLETRRHDNYWRRKGDTDRRPLWWLMDALRLFSLTPIPWS